MIWRRARQDAACGELPEAVIVECSAGPALRSRYDLAQRPQM